MTARYVQRNLFPQIHEIRGKDQQTRRAQGLPAPRCCRTRKSRACIRDSARAARPPQLSSASLSGRVRLSHAACDRAVIFVRLSHANSNVALEYRLATFESHVHTHKIGELRRPMDQKNWATLVILLIFFAGSVAMVRSPSELRFLPVDLRSPLLSYITFSHSSMQLVAGAVALYRHRTTVR